MIVALQERETPPIPGGCPSYINATAYIETSDVNDRKSPTHDVEGSASDAGCEGSTT